MRATPDPIAVVCSRVRTEERLLLQTLRDRGVDFVQVDPRRVTFELVSGDPLRLPYSGAMSREISHVRNSYASRLLEHAGVRVVNGSQVIDVCGDKLRTALALRESGVPTVRAMVGLVPEAALEAIDDFGYPSVVKPLTGSWGRLAARIHDHEQAEALLEHRGALAGPHHQITFIQEYVDKPGRDIKAYVFGGEVVGAIYKVHDHWRTNTARGGRAVVCPVTDELETLLRRASAAVGHGILGIDVIEDGHGGLLVNEINHTPEFHGAIEVLEVDLVGAYVDYVVSALQDDVAILERVGP